MAEVAVTVANGGHRAEPAAVRTLEESDEQKLETLRAMLKSRFEEIEAGKYRDTNQALMELYKAHFPKGN